jgi:hypothetical protein
LVCFARNGANACARGSANDGALQPATKYSAQHSASYGSDSGSFARPDAALIAVITPPTVIMPVPVVAAAMTTLSRAVAKVIMSMLRHCWQACSKQHRRCDHCRT